MRAMDRTVLQVIVSEGRITQDWAIADLAGYAVGTASHARWNLKQAGLIEKVSGAWQATERGKIALAIVMGKETAARARRSRQRLAA